MHCAKWTGLIVHILIIPCIAYYHTKSMKTIQPSTFTVLPDDSYFGYSVTYQPLIQSLVISAPRADVIGHIYIYNIDEDNLIKENITLTSDDNTTYTWLGATVKAGNYFYTTCAPRPVKTLNRYNVIGTYGTCFTKTFRDETEMISMPPMSKKDRSFGTVAYGHRMDTLGWSIEITAHDNVLVGGPGITKGRVIQYTNISDTPQLISPQISKDNEEFFNFGYSIASGNFYSDDPNNISYVISTPYGNDGVGQLLFYTESGEHIDTLMDSGSRLGSLFGAVLCTVKLTSKRASLLVGAPTYVPGDSGDADFGAVHVYVPDDKSLSLMKTIKGGHVGGRFGSAIVNLGDIDSDQLNDVAIAAPYENDGNGAVYIYTARNILTDKMYVDYTQKIQPEKLRTFGLSLTTIQDYDGNGCNELTVGAPESNAVVIFRCFPVIRLRVYTKLPNLQNRKTTEKDKFIYKACIDVKFPEKPEKIVADVLVTLNIMHPSAKFNRSTNGVITYEKKLDRNLNVSCRDIVVLTPLDKNIELYPIQITAKAELINDPRFSDSFDPNRGIVSEQSSLFALDKLWVSDCNLSYCVPNVTTRIATTFTSPYMVGSTDTERISLRVTNTGETAYDACVRVHLGTARVLLAPGCRRDGHTLTCEPGSPMKNSGTWNIPDITLETKFLTNRDKKINITVDTYNHCENATDKITKEMIVDFEYDFANLILTSEAIPADVVNISLANLDTEINHFYTITNKGSTSWVDMQSEIVLDSKYAEIKAPVIIYTNNQTLSCYPDSRSICLIDEIKKNQKIYIMVNLRVPAILDNESNMLKNISVMTRLNLIENQKIKTLRALSTLVRVPIPQVSIWIYLGAGLVALLALVIIVIIFYECGFLQRKNKEMLKDLKKDVRRQSMRRTMLLRESMRASQARAAGAGAADENKLLDVANKDNNQTDDDCQLAL